MIPLTAGQIAEITGGTLHNVSPDALVTKPAEFDSRAVTEGSIFLCLPGAKVDGHDFAAKAAEHGAALVIAAREVSAPAVVVKPLGKQDSNADAYAHDPDGSGAAVLQAASKLARYLVDHLPELTVVGVTGSAGKTTTKDMIASVLRPSGATIAPKGSFNNEIGHPYTVLHSDESTRYLVAELSARGVGHVAHLAQIAPPNIGAVLNVGTAHLGEFGSRETIAQAKGELVEALPDAADGGVAILNADDDLVAAMASRTEAEVWFVSADETNPRHSQAQFRATNVELDEAARASFAVTDVHGDSARVQLQVVGAHQVANALVAIAVGVAAGIDLKEAVARLGGHTAVSGRRMEVSTRDDGLVVINDSYNANPDSMRAGLSALQSMAAERSGKAVAVLGQMGELGDGAIAEHKAVAEFATASGVTDLIAVGDSENVQAMYHTAQQLGIHAVAVADVTDATNEAGKLVNSTDVVLVKASYADALWQVADGLLTSPATQN